ncbi:hypothetical protein BJY01DRAFT_255890 [Aspergillus pseudoustus]|uniref:Uncharacterized protein n=1 Tax=Aspergillus pseudoustus TaxID=1810923 RepID=A0ABR4IG69_9EURO
MPYSDADSDDEICFTPSAATTGASVPESALALSSYATSTRKAPDPVPPHKDATFIIRDRRTSFVIAFEGGNLGLYPEENDPTNNRGSSAEKTFQHSRSSHWECVEYAERYFGFRWPIGCRGRLAVMGGQEAP